MESLERSLLIYDGDCGFCKRIVDAMRKRAQGEVDYAPFQQVGFRFPEIPTSDFERAVQFIEKSRERSQGAEAVFRTLAAEGRLRWLLVFYLSLPGFKWVAERAYRVVAQNRQFFSKFF